MSGIGQEPQVGAASQTEATSRSKPPVVEEQKTIDESNMGLLAKYDEARKASKRMYEKVHGKFFEIWGRKDEAITKLKRFIPADARNDREGVFVNKDRKELGVSLREINKDYIELKFDDLVDPGERYLVINPKGITLAGRPGMIILDNIEFAPENGIVLPNDATKEQMRGRKYIAERHLNRDLLDAAAEGLAFILDPETKLKPAESPVITSSVQKK